MAPSRCRAFFNKVPGLEPDRVRALSKREAFVASRRRRRQAPEAGADLRSKCADVPLPAPSAEVDFGTTDSTGFALPPRLPGPRFADRSRCGFAKQIRGRPVARSTERGRPRDGQFNKVSPIVSVNPRRSPQPVRVRDAGARTSRCPLQFQNVRLMPAAHTCTCARYNGWGTTNVPITKKEPL